MIRHVIQTRLNESLTVGSVSWWISKKSRVSQALLTAEHLLGELSPLENANPCVADLWWQRELSRGQDCAIALLWDTQSELSSAPAVSSCWERQVPFKNGARTLLVRSWCSWASSSLPRSPCWSCLGRGRPAFALGLKEARLSPFPQAEVNCDVGCKASVFLSSRRVETLRFSNPLQAENAHTALLAIRSPVTVNSNAVAMTGIVLEVSLSRKSSESEETGTFVTSKKFTPKDKETCWGRGTIGRQFSHYQFTQWVQIGIYLWISGTNIVCTLLDLFCMQ